jgi:lantibiotic modifying enzyme
MEPRPFLEIFEYAASAFLAPETIPPVLQSAARRQLAHRLADALAPSLFLHFEAHRGAMRIFSGKTAGCHAAFVEEINKRGLQETLRDLPTACAAMELLARNANDEARELATALENDQAAIANLLGCRTLPELHEVAFGRSDPHRRGRTVAELTFANGARIFYKPRSLGPERIWRAGLLRLNSRLPLPLRAASVIDRPGHGWMEAIEPNAAMSPRDAAAFYGRCGATLCLVSLLDGLDVHRENAIIAGPDVVLIDAECLMHPSDPDEPHTLGRTGFLTTQAAVANPSFLGNVAPQPWSRELRWHDVGSDDLRPILRDIEIPEATHLPRVNGAIVTPQAARADILDGFEATARVALADPGFLAAWRSELGAAPRRMIHRPTAIYTHILQTSAHPAHMSTIEKRENAIASALGNELPSQVTALEQNQLACWDIPVFNSERVTGESTWGGLEDRMQELASALG